MTSCVHRQLGMSRILILFDLLENLNFIFMFLAVILDPEVFKKLRESPENNFHEVSSKSEPGCQSYDSKPNKVNGYIVISCYK